MRVKLRTIYAGPRGAYPAESIVDFPPAHAKELIAAGFAELVDKPAAAATAMAKGPSESAAATKPGQAR